MVHGPFPRFSKTLHICNAVLVDGHWLVPAAPLPDTVPIVEEVMPIGCRYTYPDAML